LSKDVELINEERAKTLTMVIHEAIQHSNLKPNKAEVMNACSNIIVSMSKPNFPVMVLVLCIPSDRWQKK
jgi:hypothetical protein